MLKLIYQAEPAGFGTFQIMGLPGFVGPVPLPISMRDRLFTDIPQFGRRL